MRLLSDPSPSAPFISPGGCLHILIIEDDPGDRGLIEAHLRQTKLPGGASLETILAISLAEGIAKAQASRPDLVLLDLSLPDSAQLDSVAMLLAAVPDVPVIVLTGHDDDELSMAALEAGAQDYLVKGQFDAAALGRAIRHTLARSRLESRMTLFQAALEAAADAIMITDTHGVIQWGNLAFEQLTGYSVQEALGHTPGELVRSGAHDATFYQQMWATILAGQVWRGEVVNRDKNGRRYDERLAIAPVLAGDGTIRSFVAVMHDITDRKRLTLEGADLLKRIETLIQRAGRPDSGLASTTRNRYASSPEISRLSARQREVLELVAQGFTSSEIAERLHLSKATVVTHRRDLMQKLDLHSVAELTRYAMENQLIVERRA